MADDRALGEDEADLVLCPTAVVGGDLVRRNAARRKAARHGRHDDTVLQSQVADQKRFEQRTCYVMTAVCAHSGWIPASATFLPQIA